MGLLTMQVAMTVLATILVSSGLAALVWPALGRLRSPLATQPMWRAVTSRPTRTVRAVAPPSLPERLSRDAQWDRASAVITQSIARLETVHELQRSAEQQLDSATYAIQRLFDELSGVMTVQPATPALEAASERVVHPFTPAAPRPAITEAIAA